MKKLAKYLLLIGLLLLLIILIPSKASAQINIHIRDLGINQNWKGYQQTGDHNYLDNFYKLNKEERIIIPMPLDKDLKNKSIEELTNDIRNNLTPQIFKAIKKGNTNIEIQLVQNINTKGYFDNNPLAYLDGENRQTLVKKFAAVAYQAIGNSVNDLKQHNFQPSLHLTLGSNGTYAFTENVASWKGYKNLIDQVTLVDGRALIPATNQSIQVLGADKVRIINTHKDHPAPINSIGNLNSVLDKLLPQHPELSVFYLKAQNSKKISDHIASMTRPYLTFEVKQFKLVDKFAMTLNPTELLSKIPFVQTLVKPIHNISPHSHLLNIVEARILSKYDVKNLGTMTGKQINPLSLPQQQVQNINPSSPPPIQPKGVYINPEITESVSDDLEGEAIKDEILNNRPSEDSLTWELEK